MARSLSHLKNQKVILGLSGGVDSAVAAIRLQQAGAIVEALHMTNWEDDDGYCTAAADLQDARRICEQLDIPLHHVNFAREYRTRVFEYFLDEYRAGRTPNPDVLCNREIKFGVFREYAKRLGGTWLATGHYARTGIQDGATALLKAVDDNKDQSYFLHAVRQAALAEAIFPLGDLTKAEVRSIAREHGLDVHNKKDSTGICFIGERPFREFLSTYLPANPGAIHSVDGVEVGLHHGLMYYTLGQRQGLGIGGRKDGSDDPWYVIDKRLADNVLIVAQGDDRLLYSDALTASDLSWIIAEPAGLADGIACTAKVRYRQSDQPCTAQSTANNTLEVRFDESQRAVAPGQYVVLYHGEQCLGGGVIDEIRANSEHQPASKSAAI